MRTLLKALPLSILLLAPSVVIASDPPTPQATSLLGQPLFTPVLPDAARERLEADLRAAQRAYDSAPNDEQAIIWLARRLGYLGQYAQAMDVLTRGLEAHPRSHRILRHRGHRFITLRRFDEAIADLALADELSAHLRDEIEPDGAPNALGVPRSTTRFNILYHLGLAHYLKGDFARADEVFTRCLDAGRRNDDMYVAAANWLVLARLRAGRTNEALEILETIPDNPSLIENHDYHRLLMLQRGRLRPKDLLREAEDVQGVGSVTIRYGVGAYHLTRNETNEAMEIFRAIATGPDDGSWPAFGFIAAESELARAAR